MPPTHSERQSDPFDDDSVRESVTKAWRSTREFEESVGWSNEDQRALETVVDRARGEQ